VLSWAVLGLVATPAPEAHSSLRIATSLLHLSVAFSFLRRGPQRLQASVSQLLTALPSLAICGLAWRWSPPPSAWPGAATSLFLMGAALAISAVLALGPCFAVLPAYRGLVVRGPYRFLRHPIYLGELVLVGACVLAGSEPAALALFFLAILSVLPRIFAEEDLLKHDGAYRRYESAVPFRLVPGLW